MTAAPHIPPLTVLIPRVAHHTRHQGGKYVQHLLYLNHYAYDCLGRPAYVQLFVDRQQQRLHIRPAAMDSPGSLCCTNNHGGAELSLRALLKHRQRDILPLRESYPVLRSAGGELVVGLRVETNGDE